MTRGQIAAMFARGSIAAATLCVPVTVYAAGTPGTANALTIRPLGIVKTDDLDFGIMAPSPTAGTVTINAQTGARTAAGGAILAGGTPAAAQFTIAATPARIVSFSLNPNNNLVLNRIGGGASMTVNQFRVSYDGSSPSPIGPNRTVPPSGLMILRLGGRLNILASQMEGSYQGTFSVTVDYQ